MAQLVKNPPAVQETWVQSLRWEDPLEKGKATHSSILAWRIPWTQLTDFHLCELTFLRPFNCFLPDFDKTISFTCKTTCTTDWILHINSPLK